MRLRAKDTYEFSLVFEIPDIMNEFTRKICKGFYGPEVNIIMDILLRDKCVKELDIVELLKLDEKTVS